VTAAILRPRRTDPFAGRSLAHFSLVHLTLRAARGPFYSSTMLDVGDVAPDFAVGKTTLRRILEKQSAVVFFFPKAFTPG
jgi:hypothetical protein